MTDAVPLDVLTALGRLNAYARTPQCGRLRSAIYDYKALAVFVMAARRELSARLVTWTGKCNRCSDGWFTHWEWEDGHKVRCRDCGGSGIRTLRFTETTLPDQQVWHHPWFTGNGQGFEIARAAFPGFHPGEEPWDYRYGDGRSIEWHAPESWQPNQPGRAIERDELVELLNRVEDWIEALPTMTSRWALTGARAHLCQRSHRRVLGAPSHSYTLDLGRAPGGCFVCGSDDLAGYGYGRITSLFHWSLPVCKRHSKGPEKAPFPSDSPPASLMTPQILRWTARHQVVKEEP